MRNTLSLLLALLLAGACQSDPAPDTAATATSSPAVAPAADDNAAATPASTPATTGEASSVTIAQRYQQLLDARENVYPLDCTPEAGKINPADAAPRDTTFFIFRETLKEIVANKDIFELLPFVDENIKNGFGGEDGLQNFIRGWGLDSPDKIPQSQLWPTLTEVLALGGQFTGYGENRYFVAPYLDACWPHDIDGFEYGAIVGAGVRLRAGPGLSTQIVKTLSHDLVKHLERTPTEETLAGETYPWIKVALMDGTEGFVFGKFYRSPIDFRVGFTQNETGEWMLKFLVAGD